MDEQDRLRQFYLRILLGLGIVWGCLLFITAPFIFRGANDTTFQVMVVVLNAFTIMPACIPYFWHRRMACVWLTVNALGIAFVTATLTSHLQSMNVSTAIGLLVPVLIAAALDIMEVKRWPEALKTST